MEKQLFVTSAVTETKATDVEGVGTLRWVGDKLYRWIKNESGAALSAGQVVFHDATNDTTDLYHNVQKCTTVELAFMAGVVASTTIASNEFGWIQVFGECVSVSCIAQTGTAGVVGDYLIGVVNQVYAHRGATSPAYLRNLQLLEAIASGTTATAYKKCIVNCI